MQSTIIITLNQAFYATIYLTPDETEGRYVHSEGDHGVTSCILSYGKIIDFLIKKYKYDK